MMKDSTAFWLLVTACVLGVFGTILFSTKMSMESDRADQAQMELDMCRAEGEISSLTTDACMDLLDTCGESLNVCVQSNDMVLRTCGGWEPH